jgi:hypothetical protein
LIIGEPAFSCNGPLTTDYGQVRSTNGTVEKLFPTVAAEIAKNLVVDGVGFGGYVVGGDFLISLSAEKDDLVLWLNFRNFGDVHRDETH